MSNSKEGAGASRDKKPFDLINRTAKKSNPLGTGLFVGLRALDPLLQYGILTHQIGSSLLKKVGLQQLPMGLGTNTGTVIDKLGLSPYRLILLAMAAGSAAKQIYWVLFTAEYEWPPSSALPVVIYNSFINSINSLAFTTVLASASLSSNENFPQTPLLVGSVLYVAGILVEAVSETQRKNFKSDPKNAGKPCTTGLWSVARHINYSGYAFWRAGYALASGGWIWGASFFAFQMGDFLSRAVPILDDYCGKRV
jgi:protein-S-isoprenylcysteine O-methyltransferase Ste14